MADKPHGESAELRALSGKGSTVEFWEPVELLFDQWAVEAGLAIAPPLEFVSAAALVDAAVDGVRKLAAATPVLMARLLQANDEKKSFLVRRAANRVTSGGVQKRRAPYGAAAAGKCWFWNLTCAALPSAPFPPTQQPLTQANRKAHLMARRVAKGLPARASKDAEASRALEDKGPHFTRYVDEFLGLACGPSLHELGLVPNAKELSESFACFAAVRQHLAEDFKPQDPSVTMLCIGDGRTPRTAALFAFRTQWRCLSVDPLMEAPAGGGEWSDRVDRLQAFRARVEDLRRTDGDRVLIVLPHAHVGLGAALAAVGWRRALGVVAMPCCNFYRALSLPGLAPLFEGEDAGVVSPHRLLRVWRWRAGEALPADVPAPLEDQPLAPG